VEAWRRNRKARIERMVERSVIMPMTVSKYRCTRPSPTLRVISVGWIFSSTPRHSPRGQAAPPKLLPRHSGPT